MPIPFACPHCGHQTLVHDQYVGQSGPCAGCGQTVTVLPPGGGPAFKPLGDDAGIRLLLPVGRSGWAIAAGYVGLFAVLLVPAPIALILGIVAIRDIRRHKEKHGMGRAIFGLVMGILFTIALLFLVVVGAATGFK
jgi:uncharacterized protein (DUF983 family)